MSKRVLEESKLVFTEAPGSNFISEGQSFISVDQNFNREGMQVYPGNEPTFTPEMILNVGSIHLSAHATLTSQIPLGQLGNPLSITSSSLYTASLHIDVQNGHSLCITQNLVPVIIRLDGTITLEDVTHSPVQVSMSAGSTINVTHNGKNYTLKNDANLASDDDASDDDTYVYIEGLNQFVTICSTVNELIENTTDENPFPLDKVCFLRDYQKLDHSLVEAFMAQNNMLSISSIDGFIAEHYFEFCTIGHLTASTFSQLMTDTGDNILTGSPLQSFGYYDPIQMICSHLDLEDINLNGNDNQNNGGAIDLAGDNNQNPDGGAA